MVILCFTTKVHPKLRSSLAKASAYFLKIFLASCRSSGSHSALPKRSTFSRTLCSEVESLGFNCRDIGVNQVNSFSGDSEQSGQPTCEISFCSFVGRASLVCSKSPHTGNNFSHLHIAYHSFRRNSDLLGRYIPQYHSFPFRARTGIPVGASSHGSHVNQ